MTIHLERASVVGRRNGGDLAFHCSEEETAYVDPDEEKYIVACLFLYSAFILTYAAQKDQGISKATRRGERARIKDKSSRANTKDIRVSTEQQACLR